MSSSGPFNFASGGLLVVPPLIRKCLNLPFETQGKSRRLKAFSYQQETGDQKGFCTQEGSSGSCSVSEGRCVNRTSLYSRKRCGQGRKERRADAVETVSAAGVTSEVAREESRVNWAKKHTQHVLQVCRKQGTYRNGTLAAEVGHIIPCPR